MMNAVPPTDPAMMLRFVAALSPVVSCESVVGIVVNNCKHCDQYVLLMTRTYN